MYDLTVRDAVSVKGFPSTLKWRVYRKDIDWAFYAAIKPILPDAARRILLECFTSYDTKGKMGGHVVRIKEEKYWIRDI